MAIKPLKHRAGLGLPGVRAVPGLHSASQSEATGPWRILALVALAAAIFATVWAPIGVIEHDAIVYTQAAESIADGHYRAAAEPNGVPRYPPGLPLLLAPLTLVAWPDSASFASVMIAVLLCAVVWRGAREVGGWPGAAVTGILWALSPMFRDSGRFIMSDAPAAVLVMLGLLAALRGRWVLAGLSIGASSIVRLPHALFLAASRRLDYLGAALTMLVPLAVFQFAVYGRLAGYDGDQAQFSLHYLFGGGWYYLTDHPSPWPNWLFFPGTLLGWRGSVVPLLPVLAGVELWRRRDPVAGFAAGIICVNLAVYLPYYFQSERFMLPAACVSLVFAAAPLGRRLSSIVERAAGRAGRSPVEFGSTSGGDLAVGD